MEIKPGGYYYIPITNDWGEQEVDIGYCIDVREQTAVFKTYDGIAVRNKRNILGEWKPNLFWKMLGY